MYIFSNKLFICWCRSTLFFSLINYQNGLVTVREGLILKKSKVHPLPKLIFGFIFNISDVQFMELFLSYLMEVAMCSDTTATALYLYWSGQ